MATQNTGRPPTASVYFARAIAGIGEGVGTASMWLGALVSRIGAIRSGIKAKAAVAPIALAACGAGAIGQQVSLSATSQCNPDGSSGIDVTLAAGTYRMQPVAGQHVAWFRWTGGPIGCDAAGGNCDNGWTVDWNIRRANGVVVHYPFLSVPPSERWFTPEAALAHATAVDLVLEAPETVRFFISDNPCDDNTGGVSLELIACLAMSSQPETASSCLGGNSSMSVIPSGTGPFTYHWRKNSVPMDADTNPDCVLDQLSFTVVSPDDAGTYDCIVTNACGSVTSNPAQLFVDPSDVGEQGGVPGRDGLHDNNDFIAFINYFFDTDPIADMGSPGGELGSDGQFDNNDFIVFIDQFFAGC